MRWTAAGILAVALAVAVWPWAPWRGASAPAGVSAVELTPLSFEQGGQTGAVWSPDGKAVAFGARENDTEPYQLYVRYLDSPVATRITSTPAVVQSVVQWTTTGKIIFFNNSRLWSVSPVGGEPEPWGGSEPRQPANLVTTAVPIVSKDGTSLAGLFRGVDGVVNIWTWSSGDSEGRPYEPAPFASRTVLNLPHVSLSPDGRQILLLRNAREGEEAWLMPYPASAANPPRKILPGVSDLGFGGTPTASWMPDNRHLVLSAMSSASRPPQLYLADTVSGTLTVISSGTTAQRAPAVSPDGRTLAFLESIGDFDIVTVDLATAAVTPVIASQRSEQMPAWAAREPAIVYVTDRNGQMEIWLQKPGQPDRPVVTPRDFPGKTRGFIGPALSPDGTRVIYGWVENGASITLWMSAMAGGPPVQLVKNPTGFDSPGSSSPDGNWFVYLSRENGKGSLNKVKTTGGAEPVVLDAAATGTWVPVWSPAGDWILYGPPQPKLISPDGKTTSALALPAAVNAFSADGRTIYGIRQPVANGPGELFSISVAGGPEKIIGTLPRTSLPAASANPSLRMSLTPDGKSLTFSTLKATSNLWLMDGLLSVTGR